MTAPLEELDRDLKPTERARIAHAILRICFDEAGTWPDFIDGQIRRLERRILAADKQNLLERAARVKRRETVTKS